YFSDELNGAEPAPPVKAEHICLIGELAKVRNGKSIAFTGETIGCAGGRRYSGFSKKLMPDFRYFLSCGIPGKLEGERYKKTPEIVDRLLAEMPEIPTAKKFIIFKRIDKLTEIDEPDVIIFFAKPDVLSGLFTLAGFDEFNQYSVVAPFGAGCATIIQLPYLENLKQEPKCVLGMFDVSARPYVPENVLSFAVPIKKFITMVKNMDESFLITDSWKAVMKRI
ncbi:MAG: DUF169 domain-containing protein, partial [Ignavibacteria bacterium]|nr:DUF169 domain-containing protein [Ignavibacteria bacterium]